MIRWTIAAVVSCLILGGAGYYSLKASSGFTNEEIAELEKSIKASHNADGGYGVRYSVAEVRMVKVEPNKLQGYVKLQTKDLVTWEISTLTKSCEATLGAERRAIWACKG